MGTAVMTTGLTPAQIAFRRQGIGASEVGAVLGLDRYKSPLDVWLEKTGRRAPDWSPSSQAAKMGNLLEPIVAQLAEEQYHATYDIFGAEGGRIEFATSDTCVGGESWMLATPDRIVTLHENFAGHRTPTSWLLECKTKSWNTFKQFGAPGSDQIPDTILLQCLWQMAVTGYTRCDVAVLVDGREFHMYQAPHDAKLIDDVVERVGSWWNAYVLHDVEPPVSRGSDVNYLREKFGEVTADLMRPTEQVEKATELLATIREQRKQVEEEEEMAKARVMSLLGNYKGVHTTHGKVSWSATAGRKTTDWKAIAENLAQYANRHEANLYDNIVASFTSVGAPSRTFRFTPAKGE